jgi:hypothetical protein
LWLLAGANELSRLPLHARPPDATWQNNAS